MKGARIRRRRDEIDRMRLLWVAHIDDREAVAEHMPDKGMPLVDHDLHAVAAPVQIGIADKIDVARGIGGHGRSSIAAGLGSVPPIARCLSNQDVQWSEDPTPTIVMLVSGLPDAEYRFDGRYRSNNVRASP